MHVTMPTNTGGGLVGFGHPVGATGVKQILEIYRQMKGQCEEYQVPSIPEFGIAVSHNSPCMRPMIWIQQAY